MIAIVDYGSGNLCSIRNAFRKIGVKTIVSNKAMKIRKAEKVVLPGVGNFGSAMESIREKKLEKAIKEIAFSKPFLGICLGMQLLFEESEEAPGVKGLGLVQGRIKKFSAGRKVPQMGWNIVKATKESGLFANIPEKQRFFFANSFFAKPDEKTIIAGKSVYGEEFCTAIEKGTMWATQFHPEKSGENGLNVLKNFVEKGCGKNACEKGNSLP